ncbi:MAG: alpha/beta fold hydrolase [Bryobacteraceae bacterium]|jgi:Esterase/lipase|nr:alpha/beta fold hydrolase [Bryobacteraceae bacterium]
MILYLHGFASGPTSRKAQFFRSCFAKLGIPLEIPDLTEGDFEHMTISRQLDIIRRMVGDRKVSFIGSSLGGYLAAAYAARYPGPQRLVLLAPAFAFLSRWPAALGVDRMEEWKRTGALSFYHYADRRDRKLSYRFIEDGRCYEDFPDVQQPTLIIHGRNDTTVPCELSQAFAKGRQNVELELVDSDHELTDVLDHLWSRISQFLLA